MSFHLFSLLQFLSEFPRYNRHTQDFAAIGFYARASIRKDLKARLEDLTRAYSLAQSGWAISVISRALRPYLPDKSPIASGQTKSPWEALSVGWDLYRDKLNLSTGATRTILLKEPGENGEKGVILSCFEYNWLRILIGIEHFEKFDERYTLIFSTSWSPTNYNILALALEKIRGDVFVVPCNFAEISKLEAFHPRIRPLPFLACDWLEPANFSPRAWNEREFDIVVVSNWAPFKRHWHFFRILRDLPSDLRIVCIGQPEGKHTLEDIRKLKDRFEVTQNIQFLESIPITEVNRIQESSRIALIFSRREGCCVAAVEGLMANAFLVMLEGAHVGPLAYISEDTGAKVTDQNAAPTIQEILMSETPPGSREWATREISCHVTIRKLNEFLKGCSLEDQRPWKADLATPCWRPFPFFVSDQDRERLTPHAQSLSQAYPEVFPEGWLDRSHL